MPAVRSQNELQFEQQANADGPDLVRCWLQKAPARQLPNLKMPILVLNGEASFHAPFEHCTVKYLEQAGAKPTWIDLGKAGIHGNGHMMMLEKNSDDIIKFVDSWMKKNLTQPAAAAPAVTQRTSVQ